MMGRDTCVGAAGLSWCVAVGSVRAVLYKSEFEVRRIIPTSMDSLTKGSSERAEVSEISGVAFTI